VKTTPNYSFIAPNLCDDGSDTTCANGSPGGIGAADTWLSTWVPRIQASPAYKASGLIVITFGDAPSSDTSGCCGTTPGGGLTGTLLISPYVKKNATSTTPYNTYSLLRSIEDIFGLSHLGHAADSTVKSFGSDVFTSH
jgi:hypothetical protein